MVGGLSTELDELLRGDVSLAAGFEGETLDAEVEAVSASPYKPYLLVRQWIVIEVEVDDAYKASLAVDGLSNHVLYANEVIMDSRGRYRKGDWVRSTFQRSFTKGYLFESVNSVYVLMGRGVYRKGSPRAAMAIGR